MSSLGSDPTELLGSRGPVDPSSRGLVGEVLAGRYEVLALVGRGGMGAVYRAYDRELDEVVALKVLHPEVAAQPGMLDHFRREVKLARRVTHRNVARTFELGEHEGLRFLTMEFIPGEPLSQLMRAGPLPLARAAPIVTAVCEALQAAHAAGIVHRDVKPDNVLLAGDRVVVTDFGIARGGGEAAAPAGTPAYMAPEQFAGGALTGRADVYAVGVMLFEMLTGALPWGGESPLALAARRLSEPPPDPRARAPEVSPWAAEVVQRCMAREPGDRFASASAAAEALREALARATPAAELPAPAPASLSPEGAPTLAALPLRGVGVDEDLVDGFYEDLIGALSTLRGIRVLSRGAVARALAGGRDGLAAGRELGAAMIVEGSLRATPSGLRIAVQLVEASTGMQTWAVRYDTAPGGALAVQDEVARGIFAALARAGAAPVRQAPADPEALELYLRGRHFCRLTSAEELRRAVDLFTQAHAREPDNALICSGLAMALVRRTYFSPELVRSTIERAGALASAAIERAPQLGEPHLALAQLALIRSEGPAATRAARAAIARAPSLAEAHALLGHLLSEAGRTEEGRRRLEVALALDPLLDGPGWELVRIDAVAGRWDAVDRRLAAQRGASRGRAGRWLFYTRYAAWRGDQAALQEIEAELREETDMPPAVGRLIRQVVELYLHRRGFAEIMGMAEATLAMPTLERRQQQWVVLQRAEAAGFLGLEDEVLAALQVLDGLDFFDLLWLDGCPLLGAARQRPAFAALRARVAARAEAIVEAMWGS